MTSTVEKGGVIEDTMTTNPDQPGYGKDDLEQIIELLVAPNPVLNTSGGRSSGIGLTTRNLRVCLSHYATGLTADGYKDTARESRWGPVERPEQEIKAEIFARYKFLLELLTLHHPEFTSPDRKFTLLNVGEGSGGNNTSLYDYLVSQVLQDRIDSWGIDINPDVIAKARERHPERSNRLYLMNLLNQEKPMVYPLDSGKNFPWFENTAPDFPSQFDVVIASGIFCLPVDDPNTYIEQTFRRMLATSKFGFAANFMARANTDWREPLLRYTRTDDVLEIVNKISTEVGIPLKCQIAQEQSKKYEFTVYVVRDGNTTTPHGSIR